MTNTLLLNLFLAVIYMALTGDNSVLGFVVAFVIGFGILWIFGRKTGREQYPMRIARIFGFSLYFIKILIKASLEVMWEIITPGFRMTPRIIRYPIDGLTPTQVTTLANAITLTPGTLTVDINEESHFLYIHCMYAREREDAVAAINELRDKMLKGVFGQ